MELPPELYKNYHQRRKNDLERLSEALKGNDIEPFHTLGHQLKGNAPTYGYDDLALLGEEMESMTAAEFQAKGPRLLEALARWIEDTAAKLPQ